MRESQPSKHESVPPPRSNILGRYRAFAKLARGGMADIYLAIAEGAAGVSKIVVIKRMRADISAENEERFNAMFYDEARLTTLLNHTNIVHTHEVGEDQGSLFMVMEYAEGQTVQDLIRLSRKNGIQLTEVAICKIVSEMLSALHYAHELKDFNEQPLEIVHRDVSPQNVIIGYDGRVRLLDFGIAKAAMQTTETEVGMLKGKIRYMAPEQVAPGALIDRRTDIFACGVVLWELLTRQRLFSSEMTVTSLVSLVNPAIPAPRIASVLADVSPELDAIVGRALEKSPDARFENALEMRKALDGYIASTGLSASSEEIGDFVATHFADAREKLAARVRVELAAAQSEPDSKVRSVAKLDALADLRAGPLSRRDASAGGAESSSSGSKSLPAAMPRRTIEHAREAMTSAPAIPSTDKRVLYLAGIAVFLLGVAVAILVSLLSRKEAQQVQALAPSAASSTPSIVEAPPLRRETVAVSPTATAAVSTSAPLGESTGERKRTERPFGAGVRAQGPTKPSPTASVAESASVAVAAPVKEVGYLTIDTYPWTRVTEGGRVLGNTPLVRIALSPGPHTLSLENAAENVRQTTTIVIKSGETSFKRLAFQN
jgi:serine/threonine protein kinase